MSTTDGTPKSPPPPRTIFDNHRVEELWYNPAWRVTTLKINGQLALLLQLRHPRLGFLDAVIPWHEAQVLSSAMDAAERAAIAQRQGDRQGKCDDSGAPPNGE